MAALGKRVALTLNLTGPEPYPSVLMSETPMTGDWFFQICKETGTITFKAEV